MPATARRVPEQKRVTITTKRQFTIPQKYYTDLGFDREAICIKGDAKLGVFSSLIRISVVGYKDLRRCMVELLEISDFV